MVQDTYPLLDRCAGTAHILHAFEKGWLNFYLALVCWAFFTLSVIAGFNGSQFLPLASCFLPPAVKITLNDISLRAFLYRSGESYREEISSSQQRTPESIMLAYTLALNIR